MAFLQGFDRPRALGLSATEIGVVLMLRRVHRSHWPALLDDVLYMGAVAAETINARRGQ